MTIRLATAEDFPRLLAYLVALTAESRYTQRRRASSAHLATGLTAMLQNPDAGFVVAEREDHAIIGLLVLLLHTDLISGDRGVAQVCWYVDRPARNGLGGRLLDGGLAWAQQQGATFAEMFAPEEKFERYFTRRGFHPTGRVFERSLVCQR